jgi:hypothetical protein
MGLLPVVLLYQIAWKRMNKFPAELADFRRFSTFLGGICGTYCSHLFTQLSIILENTTPAKLSLPAKLP